MVAKDKKRRDYQKKTEKRRSNKLLEGMGKTRRKDYEKEAGQT